MSVVELTGKVYGAEKWVTFSPNDVVSAKNNWWVISADVENAKIVAIDIDTIKPVSKPCPHCGAMV